MIALHPDRSGDELCCFIGTTAALISLAATAATAGAKIYAANKAAGTAQQAGNQTAAASAAQLAAAQKQAAQDQANWNASMVFNTDQYNAQQQRLAPYQNIGKAATTTLANLIGGPAMADAVAQPAPMIKPPVAAGPYPATAPSSTTLNSLLSATAPAAGAAPLVSGPVTTTGPASATGTPPSTTLNSLVSQAPVLMRAPNGQQQLVSPDLVAHYKSIGAVQVVQ